MDILYKYASFGDIIFVVFPLLAYLIGSIPFGLILTKFFTNNDLRKIGSGNIGATNVLRTGNKKIAFFTLLLDISKGVLATFIWHLFSHVSYINLNELHEPFEVTFGRPEIGYTAFLGLFAILGHCFPIWLKFKGGKGVATGLGVLLAAVPYAGLAACATWIATAKISKYSSLSALIAFLIAPIVTLFIYGTAPAVICALVTLLIWVRHKDNIKRLAKGEEPKIGKKKKEETVDPVSE